MRELPIIMSAESVRAILDDRKLATRRVVKWKVRDWAEGINLGFSGLELGYYCSGVASTGRVLRTMRGGCWNDVTHPYRQRYHVGDRLWVKETFWCRNETCDHEYCAGCDWGSRLSLGEDYAEIDYLASPECLNPPEPKDEQTVSCHDGDPVPGDWWLGPPESWNGDDDYTDRGDWQFLPWSFFTKHPSIFMPKWASRITLEVTGVIVERVQAITDAGARLEGVADRADFARHWDALNAKRGFPWASNPHVEVVEFRRVKP